MSDDAQSPKAPHDAGAWAPPGEENAGTAPDDGNPTSARTGSPVTASAPGAVPVDAIPVPVDAIPALGAVPVDAIPVPGADPEDAIPEADRAPTDAPDHAAPSADVEFGNGPDHATPVADSDAGGRLQESARWVDSAFADGPKASVPAQGTEPFAAPTSTPAPAPIPAPGPASADSPAAPASDAQVSLAKGAAGWEAERNPWAPPEEIASPTGSARGSATPPPVYGLPTITSLPGAPLPPGPGSPGGPSWDNPFAPPAGHTPYPQPAPGEAVPPPPIAPDGPGRLPYGYGYPQYAAARPGTAYPGGPGYGWPLVQPMPSNGMGTAGLVLGIITAVLFCVWPLAIVLGILAVIFGLIGRGKARRGEATNPGQALAGIICGAVGLVLAVALLVLIIVAPDDGGSDDPFGDDGFSTSLVTHRR
ncbi:DUF4190 domain-containing protein [Streptomyces sp. NPDC002935]|uniref:DUF4190 domain-containing protein n=1 Tax=Streptomyces sp. NPDC002935 TaxID=3154545 RepID=UPI0033B39A90